MVDTQIRAYVAGPMRGIKHFNFPLFDEATTWLRQRGMIAFNPAERDRNFGFDPVAQDLDGNEDLEALGFDVMDAMRVDIKWITTHATAIVMLPGWHRSTGAQHELATAELIGLNVLFWHPEHGLTSEDWEAPELAPEPVPSEAGEVRVTNPTTGGAKGTKPERYDLVPVGPLRVLARVYGMGAEKYEDRNWEKGYAWSLSYAALQRHVNAFWGGETFDPESGLHHLGHAMFHCMSMIEWGATHPELDDRPWGGLQTEWLEPLLDVLEEDREEREFFKEFFTGGIDTPSTPASGTAGQWGKDADL